MMIKIEVKGADKIRRAMQQFSAEINKANAPLAAMIVQLVTLPRGDGDKQTYPPQTGANMPPTPYYRRGIGTQTSATHNLGNSEQLHMGFTYTTKPLKVVISNKVSYAQYTIGEPNAAKMRAKGWVSLYRLAMNKLDDIRDLYALWIDKTLKELKLK